MFCETLLLFERFITFVALEWLFPSVLLHVSLQIARRSTSIVALVTFERLFSGVLSPYVNFQCTSCNARILTRCASLWLFTRMRLFVLIHVD